MSSSVSVRHVGERNFSLKKASPGTSANTSVKQTLFTRSSNKSYIFSPPMTKISFCSRQMDKISATSKVSSLEEDQYNCVPSSKLITSLLESTCVLDMTMLVLFGNALPIDSKVER